MQPFIPTRKKNRHQLQHKNHPGSSSCGGGEEAISLSSGCEDCKLSNERKGGSEVLPPTTAMKKKGQQHYKC